MADSVGEYDRGYYRGLGLQPGFKTPSSDFLGLGAGALGLKDRASQCRVVGGSQKAGTAGSLPPHKTWGREP